MIVMITNSIIPYCYDVPYVLGLPSCFSYRFRYRGRWTKLPNDTEAIKGQDGLIVLRNFDTGELVPLRFVTIKDVISAGEISYVEFQVRDYLPAPVRGSASALITDALRRGGYANVKGRDLECLVFEFNARGGRPTEGVDQRKESELWSEIVKQIGGLECYKNYAFLRLLHVRDAQDKVAPVTKDDGDQFSLALWPGTLYFLDIMQYMPWGIDDTESIETPFQVELRAEPGGVTILRRVQKVVGKYDLLRFIFKTPSGYARKHTFLEIEDKQSADSARYKLPTLFIPIRIGPPGWMRATHWFRLVLSALAISAVIASGPLGRLLLIGSDWIRSIALLTLVLATDKLDQFVTELIKGAKEVKFE